MKRIPLVIAVLVFVCADCFATNIEISPAVVSLTEDSGSFTVTVMVENAADLGGFQFDIDYDPLVAVISNGATDVVLGNVFQSVADKNELGPAIDNSTGRMTFGAYTFNSPGVNVGGEASSLATITFTVVNRTNSALTIQNIRFADATSGATIPINSVGNAEIVFSGDTIFTVVFEAGSNGSLDGVTTQSVTQGGSCSPVRAVPDADYEFSGWTGDHTGDENPLTIENVTKNMRFSANFVPIVPEPTPTPTPVTHKVTFTSGDHGNLSGNTEYTVNHGESLSPNLICDPDPGYRFSGWNGFDGTDCPPEIANVTTDMTIRAEFVPITYTVTFTSGENGTLTGETTQTVPHGSDCSQVTAVPGDGYEFAGWTGVITATANPLTVTSVMSNMTIHATFKKPSDDTDGDGVLNYQDDYPTDPQRATPPSVTGTGKILVDISATSGGYLTNVRALSDFDASLSQTGKPGRYEFEDGMVSFTVNGVTEIATVNITFPSGDSGSAVFYRADELGFFEAQDAKANGEKVRMTVGNGMVTIGVALPVTEDDCFIKTVW